MKKSQKILSGMLLSIGSTGLVASAIACKPEKWNPKEDKEKEDKKVEKLRVGVDFVKGLDKSFKEIKTTFINEFNHKIEDDKDGSSELKGKYREKKNTLLMEINKYREGVSNKLSDESVSLDTLQGSLETFKKQKDNIVKEFLDKSNQIIEEYKQEKLKSNDNSNPSDITPPSENPNDQITPPNDKEERIEATETILSREVALLYLNEFGKFYQVEGMEEKINSLKQELEGKNFDIPEIQDVIKNKLSKELLKSELDYYFEKYLPIKDLYHFRNPEVEKITLDNTSLYENGVKYSLSNPEVLKKVLKTEFGADLGVNSNTIQENELFKVRLTNVVNKTNAPKPNTSEDKIVYYYNYDPNNNWFFNWTTEEIENYYNWTDWNAEDKKLLEAGNPVYIDGVIRGTENTEYNISYNRTHTYRKLYVDEVKYALFRLHVKDLIKIMTENGAFVAASDNFINVLLKDLLTLKPSDFNHNLSQKAKQGLELTYTDGLQVFKQYSDLVANEPTHFNDESKSMYYLIKHMQRLTMAFMREITKSEYNGKYLSVYDKINLFMRKLSEFVNNGNHEMLETMEFLKEFKENYLTWIKDKENIDKNPGISNENPSSDNSEEEQNARNAEFARVFDEQIVPLETEMDSILANVEGKAYLSTEKMQIETQYKPFITRNKELKEQNVNVSQNQLEQIKSFAGLWSAVKNGIESQIRDWTMIVESKPEGEERNAYIEIIGKLRVAYNITNQFGMFLHRVVSVGRNDFTSVQMSDLNRLINDYNAQNFDMDFITGFYDIETNDQGTTIKVKEDKDQLLSKENASALYEKMKQFTNTKVKTFNAIANNDARTTKYLIDVKVFKIS